MRLIIALLTFSFATAAFAQNNCNKWAHKPLYIEAIKKVATQEGFSFEELCNLPKILDIEAQPSHTVTREGDVIPHVRIQLHMSYESCLYMVRDADKVITSQRCYSGW